MKLVKKPEVKPLRPEFSSGPCAKRLGWDFGNVVKRAFLGRSHRASGSKYQIKKLIDLTKEILEIPESYKVGLVPASNTGAFEMAMWSLLGKLPVDIFAWENFGLAWANDIIQQLKIEDYRLIEEDYGLLPEITKLRDGCDICFTWNGTTSGVRVPNADWIPHNRDGLVLCDATSAVFGQKIDWKKLDAITFSWQKAMGGEAAHGMLVLSPKAIERLENYNPDRPLPKVFRLVKGGKLIEEIFSGETINTPSMLCIADALDSLEWLQSLGGINVAISRADANFKTLQCWLDEQDWIENLVGVGAHRSNTSVCLKIVDKDFLNLSNEKQRGFIKYFVALLESEDVAYDVSGHREAPPGLRIWCGVTIENKDLCDLLPWLKWAFESSKIALE
ncbi:MAG: phosphoserine transaminase [Paracoccaceae bacterium]|nr:phosphoserine transaminase [Paracoccaceae bacterium]